MQSQDINIMIVEDESIVAEDIKYMLTSLGYNVTGIASTSETAIKKATADIPNLILMDIMLKGDIDGVSTAEMIQKDLHIPVVYLTAYTDDHTIERAKMTQPYGYIIKPFEKKELHTTIQIALYKYNMERSLKESERKYRTMFEDSGDAMYISTKEGKFIDVNQSAVDLFGYSREEILQMDILNLYTDKEDRKAVSEEIDKKGQIRSYELNLKRKDGKIISCLLTSTAMHDSNGNITGYQGIIRDITARKEREEALKRRADNLDKRYKELQCLSSISNIVEEPDYDLDNVLSKTVSVVPFALQHSEDVGVKISLDNKTYKTEKYKDSTYKESRNIVVKGSTIGSFDVSYLIGNGNKPTTDYSFLKEEKMLFSVIAERIGKIVEQYKIEQELKDSLEKLQYVIEGVIKAMATATELRDPYTAGHQRRVSKLAVAISTKMDLSQDQTESIKMAGIIHDLGKISIPAEILSKPGKLSEHEFNIIKTHSQVGYEILKTIDFPWPIAQIILQHHEKLDGSGYPQGLHGDDILLEAKIISVADVVEAMASHRPYRPALGIDQALNEVQKNKGKYYDENVVRVCLELFERNEFQFDKY